MAKYNPDYNRRARAIWAWSGLTQAELAERADIPVRTLHGYLKVNSPRRLDLGTLLTLARAVGVPDEFAINGWAAPQDGVEVMDQAVEALERAARFWRQRVGG